ncbi:DUF5979 domain-containing protein [Microbacterium sp. BK668]|uniref:DUF5979 domain-containing protein n=1 Tax=Microbacterium sp. BK668 TaxID=2512118 RepID=UPI00105F20CB|nr:DUF5979 domain-containing protein [Microbacterium sp. BK668]TDN92687.1 choice-of-anchor A domain-containing protein [Microbacterium sp. BK668]
MRRSTRPSREVPIRRRLGVLLAGAVVAGLAATVGVAVSPAPPPADAAYPDTFNPFSMNGGFTVYAREDLTMGNDETEGSLAAGGVATTQQGAGDQYTIIHVSAGTADYTLPTVDGDPTRLLVGSYSPSSGGILAITSAGTSDPSLQGDLKMVERDGPWQAFARADWLRLNLDAGNPDQTPLLDATHQDYPAHAAPPAGPLGGHSIHTIRTGDSAVADYVEENAEASYELAKDCLDGVADPSAGVGNPVGIAEDAGDRVVLEPLSADQPNVVQYADIAGAGLIQFSAGPTPGVANPLIIRVPAGTTTVSAARVDPQGAYSPYIFWDLSEITGDVAVNAAQSRIDGSIYAPEAAVTVNAAPLDGQVIGRDVVLRGGEVHSFLFAGQLACAADSGTFVMRKTLSGIEADDLPAGTTFTVNYSATRPDGTVTTGSVQLPASGETVGPGIQLPIGTTVEFDEIPPASVPPYLWADPVITPNPITIAAGAAEVVVENTAVLRAGTFSIRKVVESADPDAPDVPALAGTVPVSWTARAGGGTLASGTLDVPLDGTTVEVGQSFPLGTRIELSEDLDAVALPDGYHWVGSAWNPGRAFLIDRANTTTAVVLTNSLAPDDAGRVVSVVKETIGEAADPRYTYAISYNTDPPGERATRPIAVGDPVTLDDLETEADTLALAELVPELDGTPVDAADWDLPVFRVTIDGVTEEYRPENFEGAGPLESAIVNIPLPDTGEVVIAVGNALRRGTFQLSKDFARADGPSLPVPLSFSVGWTATTPAGATAEGTVVLPSDGTPVSPVDASGPPLLFPYGTVVAFEETGLPSIAGVDWQDPVYTPEELTIGAGGEAVVSGTVTNSAILADGTFLVRKSLVGIDPAEVLVDSFEVRYSARTVFGDVITGTIDVPADGTPVGPSDADGPIVFPVGTVVTLAEAPLDEADLPPAFDWASSWWNPTNTLIVQADVLPELEVTNSAVELTRINVVKELAGDATGRVPPGTEFSVDWWLNGEPQERVILIPDVVSETGYIPVGSIVEGREGPLPDIPGVEWGPVSWTANGGTLVPDETGRVVMPSEAMTSGATVAFSMINTAALAPVGGFSVAKTVIGAGAADVPAGARFTIQYAVDEGPVQTATLGAGQRLTVSDVPAGAVLRLRELAPPAVDGVSWGSPTWSAGGASLAPDAEGWVTTRVTAGSTVAFSLVNTAHDGALPVTGGTLSPLAALAALALILVGLGLVTRRVRRA